MRKAIFAVVAFLFLVFLSLPVGAQGFSSGSTGADGALNCLTNPCVVQLPESGILNYTTVLVPTGTALYFKPNLRNTPVIILAQGAVTIDGFISVSGACCSTPYSNGGFSGGAANQIGFGPGGGNAVDAHGQWVGPLSLVPIIGGSGGRGPTSGNGTGGIGGGAIVVASSASITVTGFIDARGGSSGFADAGGGSGGAIRLVANSIDVSGGLSAVGNSGSPGGHPGVIRLEAPAGSLFLTSTTSNPTPILSTTINPAIISDSSTPALTIASIGGSAVPSYTTARPDTVDLLLPTQLSDPISVVVLGHNIPVGTQVNMNVTGSDATVTPATLAGTLDSSTATLSVSGLSRTAVSTLYVFATFSPPNSSAMDHANPKGPDHVANIRVEAVPGGRARFLFLRDDGTIVDQSKVPRALLERLGL